MDNIIEVKDLVKVYNGSVRAVDGISFHVERGERSSVRRSSWSSSSA